MLRFPFVLPLITMFAICTMFSSCSSDGDNTPKVVFTFEHHINGTLLKMDTLMYVNAAGNRYQIDELKYFVSDIYLITQNNQEIRLLNDLPVHYVDADILSTLKFETSNLPEAEIKSVRFVFGVAERANVSGTFVNPPERDMFWSQMMGGGYHHMQMNGKWIDGTLQRNAFGLHIGKGKNNDNSYTQNSFQLTLPIEQVLLKNNTLTHLTLIINIEKWFATPNLWNWNEIGGTIMENPVAMAKAIENGKKAFAIRVQPAVTE